MVSYATLEMRSIERVFKATREMYSIERDGDDIDDEGDKDDDCDANFPAVIMIIM